MRAVSKHPATSPFFLGLDAGGTHTRWALADGAGTVQREGTAPAISGLLLRDEDGRAAVAAALRAVAAAAGPVQALAAGMTGLDAAQRPQLVDLASVALGLAPGSVWAMNDIELTCRAAFEPGGGWVVMAGTGSVAGYLDAQGVLHRAGGRGHLVDDAGGGHWIATRALRQVWRAEDAAPGSWPASPLARRVFGHIGGSDWATSRQWVYGAGRGEVGALALAVAAAASDGDAAALAILHRAGLELARLALALQQRCGARALALAGRVFDLHPAIEAALRQALPPATPVQRLASAPHVAAARLAAGMVRT